MRIEFGIVDFQESEVPLNAVCDIAPKCEYIHAHPDLIHKAETLMPDEDDLYDLAELFKISVILPGLDSVCSSGM